MQVGFLGSADSWYYSDLLRAATADEHLVAIRFSDLCGRSGTWPQRQNPQLQPSTVDSLAATFTAKELDLATLEAVLVRS